MPGGIEEIGGGGNRYPGNGPLPSDVRQQDVGSKEKTKKAGWHPNRLY